MAEQREGHSGISYIIDCSRSDLVRVYLRLYFKIISMFDSAVTFFPLY